MLSSIARFFLSLTAITPVLILFSLIDFLKYDRYLWGTIYLFIAVALLLFCCLILRTSKTKLQKIDIKISSLKNTDKDPLSFLLAYLFPVIMTNKSEPDIVLLLIIMIAFTFIVLMTHMYHFNPLLSFLGYRFYEISTTDQYRFYSNFKESIG